MKYFFETSGSMQDKGIEAGFSHFDATHFLWLFIFAVTLAACCMLYRSCGEVGRRRWRFAVAALIVADELYKIITLLSIGLYTVNYLPLHLCSINIFLIVIHVFKPSKTLDNFLYSICVPAALLAIFFPSWTRLPLGNFMHIHSFTVHILLALYPIMLTVGGEIKPQVKYIGKVLLLLVGMAIPVYIFNYIFDTNYMFLMSADKGNPLYLFEQALGNHLWGIPIILAPVLLVAYLPWEIYRKNTK